MDSNFEGGEEEVDKLSWRNAFRPDWILRLGDIKYTTHKATLMSKSLYMRDAIENSGGAGNTDLSSVLPELCWDAMPTALDFIYDGKLEPTNADVVKLFKIADTLRMKAAFGPLAQALKRSLDHKTAPDFLYQLVEMNLDTPSMKQLGSAACKVVAENFEHYAIKAFLQQRISTLDMILGHAALEASEQAKSNVVTRYIKTKRKEGRFRDKGPFALLTRHLANIAAEDSVILLTLGCELEEQDTMLVAATAVARNFQTHCGLDDLKAIGAFSPEIVSLVLDHDELLVAHEDHVWDMIKEYAAAVPSQRAGSPHNLSCLFNGCRYALLSPPRLFTALEHPMVRKYACDSLEQGMAARISLLDEVGREPHSSLVDYLCTHPQVKQSRLYPRSVPPPRFIPECFEITGVSILCKWEMPNGGHDIQTYRLSCDAKLVYEGLGLEFKVEGLVPGQSYRLAVCSVATKGLRQGQLDIEDTGTVPGEEDGGNWLSATDKHAHLDLSQGGTEATRSALAQTGAPCRRVARAAKGWATGLHYWEVEVLDPGTGKVSREVYDCIGVCSRDVPLECSTIGGMTEGAAGWGVTSRLQRLHQSQMDNYANRELMVGERLGLLLDMNYGRLSYFLNGEPLGVAFHNIDCQSELYPAIDFGQSGTCSYKIDFDAALYDRTISDTVPTDLAALENLGLEC